MTVAEILKADLDLRTANESAESERQQRWSPRRSVFRWVRQIAIDPRGPEMEALALLFDFMLTKHRDDELREAD